ncbi:outer membrane beta-barrel protein [Sphingomonas sp.]|uniref:outer membrane beta-barrel protein n=1 Tax=Sphingomonas sp. TaxID=28214 RepID=UPI0025F7B952|nr:outer membrane beta-barrel protein [Sphingomonas sp.]
MLIGFATAGSARAQIMSGGDGILFRSDVAGARLEPQYEPRPVVLGPLIADLRVTTQAGFESNVFNTADKRKSDAVFAIAPSFRILGSFGPHSATFSARANIRRFTKLMSENSETIDLIYGGRLEFGDGAEGIWATQYARDIETRGSSGTNVIGAGPAELRLLRASWTARSDFGRIGVSTTGSVVQRTYQPLKLTRGGLLDQSFRDTRAISIAPRANLAIAPTLSVFVAGSATKTNSLGSNPAISRDASRYALLAGARAEINGLIIGEIGLGYRGQRYGNPQFKNLSGFTYDATVDWYPTALLSIRVQAGRDIVNSGLTTVAGIDRRNAGLNIYYDPLRALRFSLAVDRERDNFRELSLRTTTDTTVLTGRYSFGPHLSASAYGRLQGKSSSDSKRLSGFHSVSLGVALTGNL